MAFARWDPFRDLLALQEQLGQMAGPDAPGWTPAVDLYETARDFVLTAEVPGLARDAVEIHAEDYRIAIRGWRTVSPGDDVDSAQFHRVERGHGRFLRAFELPEAIDVAKVSADLTDGILTITMPKAADRGVRRITVT